LPSAKACALAAFTSPALDFALLILGGILLTNFGKHHLKECKKLSTRQKTCVLNMQCLFIKAWCSLLQRAMLYYKGPIN
jgi:hypothetical protein